MVWARFAAPVKLLLDTHVFLWWNEDSPSLSRRVRHLLSDPETELLLSVVSAWEIVLKVRTSKLGLPAAPAVYIPARLAHYRIELITLTLAHILASDTLPDHHRDPFDRMLVSQAQVERLPIATRDPQIRKYDVETVW
jgi:PIN domain nuclease of toxin-antitoxin system